MAFPWQQLLISGKHSASVVSHTHHTTKGACLLHPEAQSRVGHGGPQLLRLQGGGGGQKRLCVPGGDGRACIALSLQRGFHHPGHPPSPQGDSGLAPGVGASVLHCEKMLEQEMVVLPSLESTAAPLMLSNMASPGDMGTAVWRMLGFPEGLSQGLHSYHSRPCLHTALPSPQHVPTPDYRHFLPVRSIFGSQRVPDRPLIPLLCVSSANRSPSSWTSGRQLTPSPPLCLGGQCPVELHIPNGSTLPYWRPPPSFRCEPLVGFWL